MREHPSSNLHFFAVSLLTLFKAAVYVDGQNLVDDDFISQNVRILFSETAGGDGKRWHFPKSFESVCRTHAFMLQLASLLLELVGRLLESRGGYLSFLMLCGLL